MVKVFDKMATETATDIVEDTLRVDLNGDVTFRASRGKGSGRPVNIPGDQFDTFVSLLNKTASRREELASSALREPESTADDSTEDSESDSSDLD